MSNNLAIFERDRIKKTIPRLKYFPFLFTKEIEAESDSHLFVYKVNPTTLLNILPTDLDKNGKPIGLKAKGKTQFVAGTGKFRLILKHQPPVNGKNTKTGDEDGGSTDVDLEFDLIVK